MKVSSGRVSAAAVARLRWKRAAWLGGCRGETPLPQNPSHAAPRARSVGVGLWLTCSHFSWPLLAARSMGLNPFLFRTPGSTARSSSMDVHALLPLHAAACRGVSPLLSTS